MGIDSPSENVLPVSADTILTISGFGQMLYQARGLSQTLTPIAAAADMERTINGTLIDLSVAQFRKYKSKVTIPSEVNSSPLDNIWPGMTVTVGCAVGLSYDNGNPGSPFRNAVAGSVFGEGAYTFYRPQLVMLVRDVETHFDEWKNVVGWSLDLEEV